MADPAAHLARLRRADSQAKAARVLAGPGEQDRRRVEDAIATARRSRAALDTTFPAQFRGLARQASPTLFPTIERSAERQARHG